MTAAKKAVINRDIRLNDLDGIKKALKFFVEREKEKEKEIIVDRTGNGRWKNPKAKRDYLKKELKKVDKNYEEILRRLY